VSIGSLPSPATILQRPSSTRCALTHVRLQSAGSLDASSGEEILTVHEPFSSTGSRRLELETHGAKNVHQASKHDVDCIAAALKIAIACPDIDVVLHRPHVTPHAVSSLFYPGLETSGATINPSRPPRSGVSAVDCRARSSCRTSTRECCLQSVTQSVAVLSCSPCAHTHVYVNFSELLNLARDP